MNHATGPWQATTKTQMAACGIPHAACRPPALMFPLTNIVGDLAGYLAKPDHPRIDRYGRLVVYEAPQLQRLVVDVCREARLAVIGGDCDLWVTPDVMMSRAICAAGHGALTLAGLERWKPSHGFPRDYDSIPLERLVLVLCNEADTRLDERLRESLREHGAAMAARRAIVRYLTVPLAADGSRQQLTGAEMVALTTVAMPPPVPRDDE